MKATATTPRRPRFLLVPSPVDVTVTERGNGSYRRTSDQYPGDRYFDEVIAASASLYQSLSPLTTSNKERRETIVGLVYARITGPRRSGRFLKLAVDVGGTTVWEAVPASRDEGIMEMIGTALATTAPVVGGVHHRAVTTTTNAQTTAASESAAQQGVTAATVTIAHGTAATGQPAIWASILVVTSKRR